MIGKNRLAIPTNLSDDWNETTHPNMINRREFIYKDTEIKIFFDKGISGRNRYQAIDHWHRYNPNTTNKNNYYLDKDGNPVRRGSGKSHIESKCN